jgi:hypothetical protein
LRSWLDGVIKRSAKGSSSIIEDKYIPIDTYLRFKVTMNYAVVPHEGERQQHLACESTDQSGCKAHKSVCLDELVEIDA